MFPSPIGELHFSIHSRIILKHWIMVSVPYRGATFLNNFSIVRPPLSCWVSVPYRGATFLNLFSESPSDIFVSVSVPYRGATFLNYNKNIDSTPQKKVSVPYRGATFLNNDRFYDDPGKECFRPLSGSYISQYHPRNPMFCLGQIGGLRGKSNFIEMQPFWKVKNSHKSSI